jgi:hypothetical protein
VFLALFIGLIFLASIYGFVTRLLRYERALLFRKFPTPCQRNMADIPNIIAV